MARHCSGCGRPLDETGHDIESAEKLRKRGAPVLRSPTGSRVRRRYACRVRLVGRSPTSGKRIRPASPQREKALGLAGYVPIDILKLET